MPAPERSRSALELLDEEERQALAALKGSLTAAGEDLCALGEVRELARRHPELAVVAGAALGALLGPWLARIAGATLPALLEHGSRLGGSTSLAALWPRTSR